MDGYGIRASGNVRTPNLHEVGFALLHRQTFFGKGRAISLCVISHNKVHNTS
jgi:hypothetical protein